MKLVAQQFMPSIHWSKEEVFGVTLKKSTRVYQGLGFLWVTLTMFFKPKIEWEENVHESEFLT